MVTYFALPPYVNWARVRQNQEETTPDPHFHHDLPTLTQPPQNSVHPPCQYTADSISTQPAQQSEGVARGDNIKWVNCPLLSTGAHKGCPRVYKLERVNWLTFSRISVPDIAVTALFWSHVDALGTFLDLKRPHVYFVFYNWVGETQIWAENSQFCIKREGIDVTVCGLLCVLTVIDEVLQVGFLRKDTVDDWMVGCVYTMCSGVRNAWVRKGSVNKDVPMENSIAIIKELLGPVPAYMCFIFEP